MPSPSTSESRALKSLSRNTTYRINVLLATLSIVGAYVAYRMAFLPAINDGVIMTKDGKEARDSNITRAIFRIYVPIVNAFINFTFVLFFMNRKGLVDSAIDNSDKTSMIRNALNVTMIWMFVLVTAVGLYTPALMHHLLHTRTTFDEQFTWWFAVLCAVIGNAISILVAVYRLRKAVYTGAQIGYVLVKYGKYIFPALTASLGTAALTTAVSSGGFAFSLKKSSGDDESEPEPMPVPTQNDAVEENDAPSLDDPPATFAA